jgi:hypothetical protein
MHTQQQTQYRYLIGKRRPHPILPPGATLPRKIAPGVFFVNGKDKDNLPSTDMLINLGITHAVLARGSDIQLSCGIKALFVDPHDPLSRIVAWMRAVRQLGAHVIVSDVAAAAAYLVVELGLFPRAAWLRIAYGIPPTGDLLLARLYALGPVPNEKGKVDGPVYMELASGNELAAGGYEARGISPWPCQNHRCRTRAESGLRHVLVLSI